MPIPEEVPYSYFDVQQYLADRKRRAQEILKSRQKDVDIDTSSISTNSQSNETQQKSATVTPTKNYATYEANKNREAEIDTNPLAEGMSNNSYNDLYENNDYNPISSSSGKSSKNDEFDLQSELESKFDKLFGKGNKKNNNDY
jgi:hypothetical protein